MHLVLINQYYPPDVAPTGVVLEKVAASLIGRGHRVTVLCAAGGYGGDSSPAATPAAEPGAAGVSENLHIVRLKATSLGRGSFLGKLSDYASFYLGVAWKLLTLHPQPDVVVALTTPPYLSVLARALGALRGARHAHWVMDLYPDVMVAHGMLGRRPFLRRTLEALTRWGWGGSRNLGVLGLGPDMESRLATYLEPLCPRSWIPLWGTAEDLEAVPAEKVAALRTARNWQSSDQVIMYSGNMGLGHRFGEILQASRHAPAGVRFAFFGRGKRRREIEDFRRDHPEAPVELHDYVAHEDLAAHLQSADVHLASLEPAWDGTMVPSKLQGIFAAGRPVIFIGSAESSIGRWILDSGAGWVVPPDDASAMTAAIREAADPEVRRRRGEAARTYALEHFDPERNARAVADFLCGIDGAAEKVSSHATAPPLITTPAADPPAAG